MCIDDPTAREPAEHLLFEAVITPHRSLTRRQGVAVALGLSAASVMTGGVLAFLGAWPVLGFSGAEIGLAGLLLVLHGRSARQRERVLLTERALRIERRDARGRLATCAVPTAWLSVHFEERRGTAGRLVLRRRSTEIEIARVLGAGEKRAFGVALGAALERLRSPRFDNPQLRDA